MIKPESKWAVSRSSESFFFGTLLSRVTGLFRDVFMAYIFGSGAEISRLMVAYRLSHLLRRVFGEGALHSAFVPAYERLRMESEEEAASFFKKISISLWLFLSAGILLSEVIFFSFPAIDTFHLTAIFLPTLFFICHAAFCSSLLQCHGSYFLPSMAPAIFNIAWMAGIFFVSGLPAEMAIWISVGVFIQWLITLPRTFSIVGRLGGKDFKSLKNSLKKLGKPVFWGLLGTSAAQINSALDALLAGYIDPEGPAYLWYAVRLEQVPLALFGIALAGALLPPLSRAFQADKEEYYALLDFSLEKMIALLIPCTVLLCLIGSLAIDIVYGHGHFTEKSASQTGYCLWGYLSGLVPQGMVLLLAPAFYARGDYSRTMKATRNSVIINITLNLFFGLILSGGVWSIAWATSLSSWFQLSYLSYFLKKQYKAFSLPFFKVSGRKIIGITIVSGIVVYFITTLHNPFAFATTGTFFSKNSFLQIGFLLYRILLFVLCLGTLARIFSVRTILELSGYMTILKRKRSAHG